MKNNTQIRNRIFFIDYVSHSCSSLSIVLRLKLKLSIAFQVTGANGFLGAHIVKEALDSGYVVRGYVVFIPLAYITFRRSPFRTVRSVAKAKELKKIFPSEKFETTIVPDLIEGDYTEALKGNHYSPCVQKIWC